MGVRSKEGGSGLGSKGGGVGGGGSGWLSGGSTKHIAANMAVSASIGGITHRGFTGGEVGEMRLTLAKMATVTYKKNHFFFKFF